VFGDNRPKKEFYRRLVNGEPISPKHQRPSHLGDDFGDFHVSDEDQQFFFDFYAFGDFVNSLLSDMNSRWRLQELAETELKSAALVLEDYPRFGRKYQIFCGPEPLGGLEITNSHTYTNDEKNVHAAIELEYVRLLQWETVVEFLNSCASYISDAGDVTNTMNIQVAMNRSLWDSLGIADEDFGLNWGSLEVSLLGSAPYYFRTLAVVLARTPSPRQ
jgi:hypothetical protein